MDTRSVVRSCRRSTRLTGQPPQDERVKRPTTGKRRDSDHYKSAKNRSDTSREGSCPQIDSTSKASSSNDVHLAIPDTNATKAVVKKDEEGLALPLFPNLRSSKAKPTQSPEVQTDHTTAPHQDSVDTSSDRAIKGHASRKWVKTERGSIRLASDSEAEGTKNNADKKSVEVEEGQHASSVTARRRSMRLASMTPGVGDETADVSSRPAGSKTKAIATTPYSPDAVWSDAEQESEPDLQDMSTRATSEHDLITHLTHHDELSIHDGRTDGILQEAELQQNTSPIPELVADIEKIVLSSPIAGGNSANDGTRATKASTPSEALRKRAPARMATRSRTLRSSSRSVENTSKIGKDLGSEQTDSESSQLDGAFDDSIRGRRKKKAQAADGTATTAKPREPRGTKRSAKELSQDEGNPDTPGPRQRRKPNNDEPNPEVDLSSANPIETATSRDSFSVDHPEVESPLNIGEFARRSDEPANPVMLAQMLSTNPERADSDIDSNAADNGSEGLSQQLSDIDSTAANDGSEGVGERLSPVIDTPKCADCGRAPERYLICAKCKEAIYCGKYCQIWNWPQHKNRCAASDEADQAEIDLQEAYLGDMWAAALGMLKEEKMAGGTLESLLLGEAVRHSHTRSARGSVGFDVDASQSTPGDQQAVDRTRAMSMRLAQAEMGGDE
ncbi:hypothetical protein INS49_007704 [Diaporthe citri]|uniref:uncharacterized protein n=1 Tax=Diaporthe citri TaxID=83186 RepID=UPI001C80B855|nr:uncharacterized protein INS49_007704 [Diaporthe citri]KAG6362612.1 hypothetical protein INS49_007704 [Diaporthe citri]